MNFFVNKEDKILLKKKTKKKNFFFHVKLNYNKKHYGKKKMETIYL